MANWNGTTWFPRMFARPCQRKRRNGNRKHFYSESIFQSSESLPNSIIFELIKGEMDYVKDLENIEVVCIVAVVVTAYLTVKCRCMFNPFARWILPLSLGKGSLSSSTTCFTISGSCICTIGRCSLPSMRSSVRSTRVFVASLLPSTTLS